MASEASNTPINVTALTEVPDLLALHEADRERFPFLLESAAQGGSALRTLGQFDILFCEPEQVICADADTDFFARLDTLAPTSHHLDDETPDLPFRGGWFVFASYELAGQVESVLDLPPEPSLPLAFAARVRSAVIVCRQRERAWLVSEHAGNSELLEILRASTTWAGRRESSDALVTQIEEDAPATYLEAVVQAKEYIAAGDVFQANLSREWRASLAPHIQGHDVYRRLRETNPAPFAGLMYWQGQYVLSSSPERLARLGEGRIDTRPIAGTRPRGHNAQHDEALSEQLIEHPKERAEHVMLIDLERNDLGRVARAGSVRVDEFMVIESYAHVHHIVSNVSGELDEHVGPGQALRAVYPGGTITGCPKVRCMEIIAELERAPRGAYTGAMGYLNHDGSGDFNILIRTAVCDDTTVRFRAGAGIVADSIPEAELQETRAKARGLRLALLAS
ncbi:MAG: aminodeoxychorismate synthase component I [Gammaproteobacteria bacterium]